MTPQLPVPHRRSGLDTAATAIFSALAALAALASLWFSLFFVMATDSCGPDNFRPHRLALAYVMTWGGIGIAGVIALVGMIAASRRAAMMWVWPALALLVVIATLAGGAGMATSVVE